VKQNSKSEANRSGASGVVERVAGRGRRYVKQSGSDMAETDGVRGVAVCVSRHVARRPGFTLSYSTSLLAEAAADAK
jgi:hypothetical protein